jgi:hypothetical protein
MAQHKYCCNVCVFNTNYKNRYNTHLTSHRHKQKIDNSDQISIFSYICNKCERSFKSNSGLWSHKSKCTFQKIEIVDDEMKETMKEIKNMMVDIKSNCQPSCTNIENQTNQINNNNNNINVNLILNENFTKSINFLDMIKNMEVDKTYQPTISSENYVLKVVQMLKNELDKLPIDERPIQCIKNEDEHQQILHIRHENKWNKETELEWTQQIHNYYLDDGDEATKEEEKIIFNGLKQLEENIIKEIAKLYSSNIQREYSYEIGHPPNKVRIIKCLLEYVNIEKNDLLHIIEQAYLHR